MVGQKRGELGVGLDGAFVLEIANLDVQTLDLPVEQGGGAVCKGGFFSLQERGFLIQFTDSFAVSCLFGMCDAASVRLDVFLDTVVLGEYLSTVFGSDFILGQDFLEDMLNLRRQIGHRLNPVLKDCRGVFCHGRTMDV